ncbi:MAG: hypothetical protein NTZ05_17615 [Chloroflexi bacterium]|nr:hypothetical protein [Chloroflexota bacterium]
MNSLIAHVEDLPGLFEEWDSLPEHVQVSESLGWDHLMADLLTELDQHYRAGEMPPEQASRYRDLLCKLKDALPIIDQLRFWRPEVSLEP